MHINVMSVNLPSANLQTSTETRETVDEMADSSDTKRDMKVLALGLPRTGSASIAEALTILGYKNVHHGIKAIDDPDSWKVLNRAADATFPVLPTYTGKPFTRAQWDDMYGSCEAATDMAALFAPQLISIYPDAKVILVIRDFDKWYKSYNTVFTELWSFGADLAIDYAEPLIGYETGRASRKTVLGFFNASNVDEARRNARQVYDRHNRVVREMVPPERLLVYHMGQGWEPICDFLGKTVPDAEFPRINEAEALKEKMRVRIRAHLVAAARVVMPWVVTLVAVGVGLRMVATRGGLVG
jgi:hypothetical protein